MKEVRSGTGAEASSTEGSQGHSPDADAAHSPGASAADSVEKLEATRQIAEAERILELAERLAAYHRRRLSDLRIRARGRYPG